MARIEFTEAAIRAIIVGGREASSKSGRSRMRYAT
jgi:hypothetical protein